MLGQDWSRTFSIIAVSSILTSLSAIADAQIRLDFPAQPLGKALAEFGRLAHLKVLFGTPIDKGIRAPKLRGKLSADDALTSLLAGTGLRALWLDERTVYVVSASALKDPLDLNERANGGSYPLVAVHLEGARADGEVSDGPLGSADSGSSTPDRKELDEVIVSAQKRSERLEDVPMAVTAIKADTLVDDNQVRVQDYFTSVPGLSLTTVGGANQVLSIRGITSGVSGNPTVGVTVDDVPYGASTFDGGSQAMPDIDPGDLARVEVLRGPQGTLYGASSMGGLIKFVTIDPSTDAVSGRVQAGVSGVNGGAEPGYNFRGSVNVPLTDTVAVRASAFTRQDPGYIDNPILGIDGVNEEHVSGGRLSALWKPSETLSLKLSALVQDDKGDGSPDAVIASGLGDLQQNYLPGVGGYERKNQAYSAIVNAKLGSFDLTSVSGYNVNSISESWDYSAVFRTAIEPIFDVTGAPYSADNATHKFTQEIRLTAPLGERIDWLFGGFYTHESSSYLEGVFAEDALTGREVGEYLNIDLPTTYQEYAAFTDLTFKITDWFDVQVGGRESHISEYKQTSTETVYGLSSPIVTPAFKTTPDVFTYLFTPRFKISQDLLVYARLASGYRAGSPNTIVGVPPAQQPDKTQSYELGIKDELLNHALSIDISAYYVNWQDIQLALTNANHLGYGGNASSAKSQGVEISVGLRPIAGLSVDAWVAINDAVLTAPLPASAGAALSGDRLPGSGRFTGNLSAKEEFPLTRLVTGFVGGALSYVGERANSIANSPSVYPAYAKTDLRAGVTYQSWEANLFVENLTDRRGVLNDDVLSTRLVYIQPRTVGLNLTHTF